MICANIRVMLEFLVELVIDIFGDILFQVVFEVVAEFGLESLINLLRPRKATNPVLAFLGLLFLGGVIGVLSGWIFPHRLFHPSPWPGLSLILAPIGTGLAMHLFGCRRNRRGGHPTFLASFWGGTAFAFGMALPRFLMIGHL